MPHAPRNHLTRSLAFAIVILAAVLALLVAAFSSEIRGLQGTRFPHSRQAWLNAIRHRTPLALSSPDQIRPWMTFDYLNKVFKMPPEYLKTSLNITDQEYPRLSLGRLARRRSAPSDTVVNEVKSAVQSFLAGTH